MTNISACNPAKGLSSSPLLFAAGTFFLLSAFAHSGYAQSAAAQTAPGTVVCLSQPGERTLCAGDTSGGVALKQSTGNVMCLLGKSWGYDDKGVWVSDGCSGEFQLGQHPGQAGAPGSASPTPEETYVPLETYGEFTPGDGFLIGRSGAGSLSISGYALFRYMNQVPDEDTFTDHLGNERPVDGRNDFYSHRLMVFFKGWMGTPKLVYSLVLWTVNATDQRALFGVIGYQLSKKFSVYGGMNGNPGTRSLSGSHPYWLGNDRVMADEFFRPFFGSGVWAQGEILPGVWYNGVLSNIANPPPVQ